jgi:heptosyltransferase-2
VLNVRVAIIKPDHLGDLVLSSPAIRAVSQRSDATLFVGPWNRVAAAQFFPGLAVETITFGHLSKSAKSGDSIPDLRGFDCVAVLRNDHIVNPGWADLRARDYVAAPARNDVHQTLLDHTVVHSIAGDYDIDALFYGAAFERYLAKLDRVPQRVGLSVGSGFHANLWPITRWIELARTLLDAGREISIIAGPGERERGGYIAAGAGLDPGASLIIGSTDMAGFLAQVAALDLVVATDGGAAHLCSTVTPIVAIFGPSPFRRYAPFGQATRLVTRDLGCSPCCQYTTNLINGCLTMECMTNITTDDIMVCLGQPASRRVQPRRQPVGNGVQMWWGLSHIGRPAIGYYPGSMAQRW